jgi:EpsI family protein
MRFGPGDEHVWFGRAFFVLVVFVMFWVGRRWHDEDVPSGVNTAQGVAQPGLSMLGWLPAIGAWFALLAGPMYLNSILDGVEVRLDQERERLQLMHGRQGWNGPLAGANGWKPMYSGALVERSGVYRDAAGATVDAFVGVYSIGTSGGTEMISYNNRIFSDEHRILGSSRLRSVGVPGQAPLELREEALSQERDRRLVWYWFMVGDRRLTDSYSVKAYEALSMFVGGAVTERIVTLSTPIDGSEVSRLESFVASHANCVAAGFAYEACGQ